MKHALALTVVLVAGCGGTEYGTRRVDYPNGVRHWEYATVDGVPHGMTRVWHTNGELQSEGTYVRGAKHGVFTFWRDDGEFLARALFDKDVEVWRTTDFDAKPPAAVLAGLDASTAELEAKAQPHGFAFSKAPPAPYFATLDRTTALARAGLQIGFGDAGEMRTELFGNYVVKGVGVYGQLAQTQAEAPSGVTLSGRRTLEAGATRPLTLGIGTLIPRAGLLVPIGNDNMAGFVAGSSGVEQRVTDAAATVPGSVALRTGASLTRGTSRVVLQADGGIDWLFGAPDAPFDAFVRANAGAGVGVRSLLLSAELTNALRVSDPSLRVHAIAVGTTLWIDRIWLSLVGTQSFDGHTSFTGVVGYEP